MMRFVVDSNIFISALLRDGAVRRLLLFPGIELNAPDFVRSEVLGHMDMLRSRSNLTIREAREAMSLAFSNVRILPFEFYEGYVEEAYIIMKDIDEDDAAVLAAGLSLPNDGIWTNDVHLHRQKRARTVTTPELIRTFPDILPRK